MEFLDLTGRYLILEDQDGFTLSRFAEQVGDALYLMEPCCPRTGVKLDYGEQFMVNLFTLALLPGEDPTFPRARLFPDYAAVAHYHEKMGGVGSADDDVDADDVPAGPTLQ